MKKYVLYAALLGLAQLSTGCQRDADVRPASYDALALATGHWEWDSSAYQGGLKTPGTVGYTRQLIFGPEGQLLIHRRGQADYRAAYQFSMGTPQPCGGAPVPLVTYPSEPNLPNTPVKLYRLDQHPGLQLLTLSGEGLCLDSGAQETYHWVAE